MTLVVDASVVAEVLLGTERGAAAAAGWSGHDLIAPMHLTAEVLSVLRGWVLGGHLDDDAARQALRDLEDLGVDHLPMPGALGEVWALRHTISAYDALYVVLARAAGCCLQTLDARLVAAAPDCAVQP